MGEINMNNNLKEELFISNSKFCDAGVSLDFLKISVDGAEKGCFWILDEGDTMIKIRFKDAKKVINFIKNRQRSPY